VRQDKTIVYTFSLSLSFIVIGGVIAFLGLPTGSGDLILRFDNFHNEVIWTGSIAIYYGILGTVLAISVINLVLAKYVYDKEKFLSYVLAVGNTAITLLFLIATGAIALIN